MYATRFADGPRFRPASMGAALAINGAVIAALLLAAPEVVPKLPGDPIDLIFIPKPLPSPPPPQPHPTARATRQPTPQPTGLPDPGPRLEDLPTATDFGFDQTMASGNGGTGTGDLVRDTPRPAPLPPLVGASFDPRYAADVEPPYPDSLRDAGIEGAVTLRIAIGSDGRVARAEPLAGDKRLTQLAVRHVLARWRFRPATRGGVPEESVKVMIVRFHLND